MSGWFEWFMSIALALMGVGLILFDYFHRKIEAAQREYIAFLETSLEELRNFMKETAQ